MQVINWPEEEYFFTQNVLMGDKPYNLEASWNDRDQSWVVSIITNDGEYIVTNRRLALNTDVLDGAHSVNKPQGYLLVAPITPIVVPITQSNMGIDILLIFISDDEVL